ncbi:hypothetical protein KDW40_01705 [Burkholderia cenocepacia]|uniref:hypothetical protein n=1 Tax=Burkholderia cenocepacia TaxID=95486 RepID=UPI001B8F93DD|nr:hypothetical protein [Burkholderia cenocepacia]MBR8043186.1 hypothetical protein [Burkholderia cenocepacia]MBR8324444.1 hypothetical protein [Burkholderia cenocepacia]
MKPQHYAQELHAAIADEVTQARNRLKVLELTDEQLLEQLRIAQRHNPKTGFSEDCAGVVALRMEWNHRRDVAAQAAAKAAAEAVGLAVLPLPEGHVLHPKEHGEQKESIYRFVMEQQRKLNARVPALIDALRVRGFHRDRNTGAYVRGDVRVYHVAGNPSVQFGLDLLLAYSAFEAKAIHSVVYPVRDSLDADPANIVDQIVAAADTAQADHDRCLAALKPVAL